MKLTLAQLGVAAVAVLALSWVLSTIAFAAANVLDIIALTLEA